MCTRKSLLVVLLSILPAQYVLQAADRPVASGRDGIPVAAAPVLAVVTPAQRSPAVSPYDDGHVLPPNSTWSEPTRGGVSAGGITLDVHAASAPNAYGSPSWSGYLVNALNALQNNLTVSGTRATDPTGYERAPAVVAPGEIAVTSFTSWRGIVSPPAPFASELGNRMHFGLHAYGDGATQFKLVDLTFAMHSDDPWDQLVYVGDFIGLNYNGTTRYGVDWGADNAPGGGDDTVYISGNGTTLVDEIVYVGVGNAWWPSGGTPQADMDDYFAWIASDGPINVSCTYDILGYTGSDSVLVDQVTVDDFGVEGWKSDDTRDGTGAHLVGTNYTHYGRPGQIPTAAHDTAIASQILFVNGPGGVSALEMAKVSTTGLGKCSLSKVNESGFASDDWRAGFFANYRYYAGTSTEATVLKIGIRSPLWGTGAGQSQNGFTATRSGESAWDLILVDWRGSGATHTVGAWDRFNTDADTDCWYVYRQSGNAFFNVSPGSPMRSLNDLYAMSDLGTPAHVARPGYTWSQMLFGTGAKVVSMQFGVGSSATSTTTYIDYVDTNLLNGGARVDFGPAPVTLDAYPSTVPDESLPQVNLGDAPTGFGPDSWRNCLPEALPASPPYNGKVNWHARYLADGDYLSNLFPGQAAALTVNDIASIRYWTKRPAGTVAGRDWLLFIYTRPPGDASWYGKRFVNNYNEHTEIGAWTQYSTDNDMTFRKNSGTPTGLMDFATLKTTYGTELVEMISVQTDSGWNGSSGFDGSMDGLTITLTNGSVGRVDFVRQPTLTLEPDDECYADGDTVTVEIWMRDVAQMVVGGQFFLQYDQNMLDFLSAVPGGGTFTDELYEVVSEGSGTIDYSVNATSGDPGVSGSEVMAVLTFEALAEICTETDLITWRAHDPPTRLSDADGGPVYPELLNMDVSDDEAPTITTPASNSTVECNGSGNAVQLAAWLASNGGAAATDNCGVVTWTNDFDALSDLCGATGEVTVIFTATDDCGNDSTTSATFTIEDTTDPATSGLAVLGGNVDIDCEETVTFSATVTDNCCVNAAAVSVDVDETTGNATMGTPSIIKTQVDSKTVTISGSVLVSDLTDCPATVQVTVNATDCCGNAAIEAQDSDDVNDVTDPVIADCPNSVTVYADAGSCSQTKLVEVFDFETIDPPFYNYYADLGNFAERSATSPFGGLWSARLDLNSSGSYARVRAPITGLQDVTVGNVSGMFQAYIMPGSHPGVGPYMMLDIDANQNGTWDGDGPGLDSIAIAFVTGAAPFKQGCWYTDGLNGATTVHVVGDRTGLGALEFSSSAGGGLMSALRTHTFSGSQNWGSLRVLNVRVGAGLWPGSTDFEAFVDDMLVAKSLEVPPAVDDNCGGGLVTGVRSDAQPLNAVYPSGATTITWTATDCCGNDVSCNQIVTVDSMTEMDVTVELESADYGPFTRCITFELWDCPDTAPPAATVNEVMTFTGGTTGLVTIEVPCGNYDCITARDKLHTLRRTDEAFNDAGTQYVADFTGDPSSGGDWLIGGNLNDDKWIDILDFGVFSSKYLFVYGTGNTTCSTAFPHADISGNGSVNVAEFSFIQINFLKGHEANCCGAPNAAAMEEGPVTSISVEELVGLGLGNLAVGDLNHDGWLDEADMAEFAAGTRPVVQPPVRTPVMKPMRDRPIR